MTLFLLLACGTAAITLKGDDTGNIDSADADTDADTDADSDADADADTDTDTDADSDVEPNPDAGSYTGRVDGTITMMGGHGAPDQVLTCSGECSFVIDDAGTLTGDANCGGSDPNGVPPMEGVLSGSTGAGAASGEWTVHVGPDSAVLPLQGPLGGGSAMLSGHLDFGGGNTGPSGSIDVTMAANK